MQYMYICTIIYVSMCIMIHKYRALKIDEFVQDTSTSKAVESWVFLFLFFMFCVLVTPGTPNKEENLSNLFSFSAHINRSCGLSFGSSSTSSEGALCLHVEVCLTSLFSKQLMFVGTAIVSLCSALYVVSSFDSWKRCINDNSMDPNMVKSLSE